ncbi:MAG: M20 family metallo-hydrolase [Muribaculaceae bacterium]|nr:M20 family metallo-hydrolase [Muribaculaceae bacterium]
MLDDFYYDSVDLLKQLIATPSVSRDETAAADIVESFARNKMAGEVRRHQNNIIVTAPGYDPSRHTLLLNSHIDTVKPVEGWTRDPFSPFEDEHERLFGLGSNDAGASLVSLMAAYRFLTSYKQSYNLVFVASAEEEVSGKNGFESVVSQLPEITMAIVGEPTAMNPAVAEKGLMVLDGEAHGVAGHAARNEGVNAIYKAMDAISILRDFKFEKVSETLGPVKVSVTQISAGTQHNVVPDVCRFVVDVRSTDAYSNEETLSILRNAAGDEISLIPRSTRLNPSGIGNDNPVVKRLLLHGRTPFGSPTLSDQALMPWPSVKLGPGESSRSHNADEYICLHEIREAIELYTRVLHQLTL